jgi:hypothetical protein
MIGNFFIALNLLSSSGHRWPFKISFSFYALRLAHFNSPFIGASRADDYDRFSQPPRAAGLSQSEPQRILYRDANWLSERRAQWSIEDPRPSPPRRQYGTRVRRQYHSTSCKVPPILRRVSGAPALSLGSQTRISYLFLTKGTR